MSHRSVEALAHHTKLAMSDKQLSRLQAVPLTPCSRAEPMRAWEACLTGTAEAFFEEITVVQQHFRPEEVPSLARIVRSIAEAFVRWPSIPRSHT